MKRIRSLLIALALVASSILISAQAVTARPPVEPEFSCVTTQVIIYENGNLNGDQMYRCFNTPSLVPYTTGLHDGCLGMFSIKNPNWNDCVSSFKVWIPLGCTLHLWKDINYSREIFEVSGPINGGGWTMTGYNYDNVLSSISFGGVC